MKRLQIYGDSILKGVTLNEETQKYYINDAINFDEIVGGKVEVSNFSKFGCTIEKGKNILNKNFLLGNVGDYVIVEYGGNDSDFNWTQISQAPEQEHYSNTPIGEFKEKYKDFVLTLKERGAKPILVNLIPVDAQKYLSWICRNGLSRENILLWLGDVYAIYRYQEQYSHAIEEISVKMGLPLIDLRSRFICNRKIDDLFCSDGIHPSPKGQKIINTAITEFVCAQSASIG